MEKRYYLFPGQTLANTKISDRSHALHITREAYDGIRDHLKRNQLAREMKEKEEEQKRYLGEGSRAMIKNWANSLENIRKKKVEEREKAIEVEKLRRQEKFASMKKQQDEMRKLVVEKAKKGIFMNGGTAKMLTSAWMEGEVMHEREKQIEFKAKINEFYKQQEVKDIEDMKRITKENAEELIAERVRDRQKKKEFGDKCRQFLAEKAKKERDEYEKKKLEEARDQQAASDEIECMANLELESKNKKRRELKANVENLVKRKHEALMLQKTEEKELDECVQAYRDAKDRIDCMTKAREIEIREETVKKRVALTEQIFKIKADNTEKEEASLRKAAAEYEAALLEKEKEKEAFIQKQIKERLEERQKFLEQEKERQKSEEEAKRWMKLNNFKSEEVMKKLEEEKWLKKKEKQKKYKEELFQQMAEKEATEKRENDIDEYITKAIAVNDDERFFELADEVMTHAKEKGRPTRPIDLAILEYKKINSLKYEKAAKYDRTNCVDYMEGMRGYTQNFLKQSEQIKKDKRKCKCMQ